MASSTASGSLCPPAANSLMPLSGIGLCDAEIITPRSAPSVGDQERDGGRGQHPDAHRVGTGRGEPGDDRGLEHLAARPRVAADDGDRPVRAVPLGEHAGGGRGQRRRRAPG